MSIKYETGAVRSDKLPHYRDLPLSLLIRGGEAYREGAEKYEKEFSNPLDKNWRKGDLRFAADAIDHAMDHLLRYVENLRRRSLGLPWDTSEDHLGHLVANLGMLSEFEEAGVFDLAVPLARNLPVPYFDADVEEVEDTDFLWAGDETDSTEDPPTVGITQKVKDFFGVK